MLTWIFILSLRLFVTGDLTFCDNGLEVLADDSGQTDCYGSDVIPGYDESDLPVLPGLPDTCGGNGLLVLLTSAWNLQQKIENSDQAE